MKIAIITETFLPSTDGIVTRLCETIKWLESQGHQVMVVAPELGVNEYCGAEVKGVPARRLFFYRTKQFALPSRLVKKYLEAFQPDLVHVVNPALLGLAGIYYARRLGIPLVASYHTNVAQYMDYYHLGLFKPLIWHYFRFIHNQAEINLCTSLTVKKELDKRKFKNVQLWKRGVDPETFCPEKRNTDVRRRITQGHPDKKVLLYVGRLAAEKEIEKIKNVLDRSPELWLVIAGDGPYRRELENCFRRANVTFTGFLHGQDLAEVYASSDIFVFPSTTETLGLVILEAMASGLPVIAADSGPSREQIEDGKNGLFYQPSQPDDLSRKVLSLTSGELDLRTMGKAARQTSIDLGWSRASNQLLDFYLITQDDLKIATEEKGLV
ncbi:glycosyltransferase family 1 protein [Sporolactobacillus shoreae]|uniref:Glycosyltransferase family 1 protein n=1 Tax=Sporolactobacillus shoreae TaxID=1465501 RepID=A0A4Z0GL03_9BACL|nr:glycosyltransferase family 1 protein [Sporolactobacillus shoreae]TGA97605.1 glycosyltransferase family 1 protein [Sporolactobacillus shoreae]